MKILNKFKKDEMGRTGNDKISIIDNGFSFLTGFVEHNNLQKIESVDIYFDVKKREIAFVLFEGRKIGSYKLNKSAYQNQLKMSENIQREMNITKKDHGKYLYKRYQEDGKSIFVIQLDKKQK